MHVLCLDCCASNELGQPTESKPKIISLKRRVHRKKTETLSVVWDDFSIGYLRSDNALAAVSHTLTAHFLSASF